MLQFEWMNENSIEKSGDCWKIFASPKSDFFCNNETVGKEGITPASLSNAPFYYTEVSGDFVMRVKVSLDLSSPMILHLLWSCTMIKIGQRLVLNSQILIHTQLSALLQPTDTQTMPTAAILMLNLFGCKYAV